MLIIDAHPHIYSADEERYPPIEKPYRPPAGKGTVEHLKQECAANGVAKVVAIQTSTFYRWDNRFVFDSVKANRDWMTGVCTLNPDDVHSPDLLFAAVRRYGIRGLRSITAADGRLDHPGVNALWRTAAECGIVVNALINADKADQLAVMLERHADLRVVLDHCLNLRVGERMAATLQKVVELARYPNLHAKLTFLPTGTAEPYPFRDLHGVAKRIIAAFTPDRCVWGSDFPCELWCPNVTYAQHLQLFKEALGLSEAEKEAILSRTALRLWFGGKE